MSFTKKRKFAEPEAVVTFNTQLSYQLRNRKVANKEVLGVSANEVVLSLGQNVNNTYAQGFSALNGLTPDQFNAIRALGVARFGEQNIMFGKDGGIFATIAAGAVSIKTKKILSAGQYVKLDLDPTHYNLNSNEKQVIDLIAFKIEDLEEYLKDKDLKRSLAHMIETIGYYFALYKPTGPGDNNDVQQSAVTKLMKKPNDTRVPIKKTDGTTINVTSGDTLAWGDFNFDEFAKFITDNPSPAGTSLGSLMKDFLEKYWTDARDGVFAYVLEGGGNNDVKRFILL